MSEASNSESVIYVSDSEALRCLLEEKGFDTSLWGEGPTKTVKALWEEIDSGETEIIQDHGGIIRRTHVVGVDVLASLKDGRSYRLLEEKQVFVNGSERRRDLITSLGEKVKPTETTEEAVRRAVAEELGITSLVGIELAGDQVIEKDSSTYNGLASQLLLRLAKVTIAEEDFNPEGYMEEQQDKTVYFKWQEINQ